MPWLTLTGVPPYDGRYELKMDGGLFSIFEWGWLKRFAGIYPTTLWDGFDNADQELVATLAVIALHRAGRITDRDAKDVFGLIGRGEMGATIQIEPDQTTEDAEDDQPPLPSRQTGNGASSGDGSATSSEPPAAIRPATGTPGSATSASASMTSAT